MVLPSSILKPGLDSHRIQPSFKLDLRFFVQIIDKRKESAPRIEILRFTKLGLHGEFSNFMTKLQNSMLSGEHVMTPKNVQYLQVE